MAPLLPNAMRRPQAVGVALAVVGLLAWGGKIRGIESLALGGRHFINTNNNQMEDGVDVKGCIGEEARPG